MQTQPQFAAELLEQLIPGPVTLAELEGIFQQFKNSVLGILLAAWRLHQGKFIWPAPGNEQWQLESAQLDALVLGLPWQRMGDAGIITVA